MVEVVDLVSPLSLYVLLNKITGEALALPYGANPQAKDDPKNALIAAVDDMARVALTPMQAWVYAKDNAAGVGGTLYSSGQVQQITTLLAAKLFIGHSWTGQLVTDLMNNAVELEKEEVDPTGAGAGSEGTT